MSGLQAFGRDFAIPFFSQLWDFLGTPLVFGLNARMIICGVFVINLSIKFLNLIFGIGANIGSTAEGHYSIRSSDPKFRKRVRGFGG